MAAQEPKRRSTFSNDGDDKGKVVKADLGLSRNPGGSTSSFSDKFSKRIFRQVPTISNARNFASTEDLASISSNEIEEDEASLSLPQADPLLQPTVPSSPGRPALNDASTFTSSLHKSPLSSNTALDSHNDSLDLTPGKLAQFDTGSSSPKPQQKFFQKIKTRFGESKLVSSLKRSKSNDNILTESPTEDPDIKLHQHHYEEQKKLLEKLQYRNLEDIETGDKDYLRLRISTPSQSKGFNLYKKAPDKARDAFVLITSEGLGFVLHGSRPPSFRVVDRQGAAEAAGILVGDHLLQVNGVDVAQLSHGEVKALIHMAISKNPSHPNNDQTQDEPFDAAAYDEFYRQRIPDPDALSISSSSSSMILDRAVALNKKQGKTSLLVSMFHAQASAEDQELMARVQKMNDDALKRSLSGSKAPLPGMIPDPSHADTFEGFGSDHEGSQPPLVPMEDSEHGATVGDEPAPGDTSLISSIFAELEATNSPHTKPLPLNGKSQQDGSFLEDAVPFTPSRPSEVIFTQEAYDINAQPLQEQFPPTPADVANKAEDGSDDEDGLESAPTQISFLSPTELSHEVVVDLAVQFGRRVRWAENVYIIPNPDSYPADEEPLPDPQILSKDFHGKNALLNLNKQRGEGEGEGDEEQEEGLGDEEEEEGDDERMEIGDEEEAIDVSDDEFEVVAPLKTSVEAKKLPAFNESFIWEFFRSCEPAMPRYYEKALRVATPPVAVRLWIHDDKDYKAINAGNGPPKSPLSDPEDPSSILFNTFEGYLNRKSFIGRFSVVDSRPLYPLGRTGFSGRGMLLRWGPNHFIYPVLTRWGRDENGRFLFKEGKKIMEVLVASSPFFPDTHILPELVLPPNENEFTFVSSLFTALFTYAQAGLAKSEVESKFSAIARNVVDIYTGIIPDSRSTDNAWVEGSSHSFHDHHYLFNSTPFLLESQASEKYEWIPVYKGMSLIAPHIDLVYKATAERNGYFGDAEPAVPRDHVPKQSSPTIAALLVSTPPVRHPTHSIPSHKTGAFGPTSSHKTGPGAGSSLSTNSNNKPPGPPRLISSLIRNLQDGSKLGSEVRDESVPSTAGLVSERRQSLLEGTTEGTTLVLSGPVLQPATQASTTPTWMQEVAERRRKRLEQEKAGAPQPRLNRFALPGHKTTVHELHADTNQKHPFHRGDSNKSEIEESDETDRRLSQTSLEDLNIASTVDQSRTPRVSENPFLRLGTIRGHSTDIAPNPAPHGTTSTSRFRSTIRQEHTNTSTHTSKHGVPAHPQPVSHPVPSRSQSMRNPTTHFQVTAPSSKKSDHPPTTSNPTSPNTKRRSEGGHGHPRTSPSPQPVPAITVTQPTSSKPTHRRTSSNPTPPSNPAAPHNNKAHLVHPHNTTSAHSTHRSPSPSRKTPSPVNPATSITSSKRSPTLSRHPINATQSVHFSKKPNYEFKHSSTVTTRQTFLTVKEAAMKHPSERDLASKSPTHSHSVHGSKHPLSGTKKQLEICVVCNRNVYQVEKRVVDERVYHEWCMRCKECNKKLTPGNYASGQGHLYCKIHFKQLFQLKGNYDEGFGHSQRKKNWT